MEMNIWKGLLSIEAGAALLSFMLGFGAAVQYEGISAGIAMLCGVGFLNAALLTVIIDKLSSKDSGKKG